MRVLVPAARDNTIPLFARIGVEGQDWHRPTIDCSLPSTRQRDNTMWQCAKCREELADSFEVCWNCGTTRDGVEDPDFRKADEIQPEEVSEATAGAAEPEGEALPDPLLCPRCQRKMDYVGTKAFHEGTRWGGLGDLGELFVNREKFDVYCCPRCGRVEFFIEGIGERFRPH